MTILEIESTLATYFRFERQFPIVAVESRGLLRAPDILVMTKDRLVYEIEVKRSIDDLKQDKNKSFKHAEMLNPTQHSRRWIPSRFYFAVPEGICSEAEQVIKLLYPYAGLLSVGYRYWPHVRTILRAKDLHKNPLNEKLFNKALLAQSSTVCRLLSRLVKLQNAKPSLIP